MSVELEKLCKSNFIFVLAQKATKFRKQNFKQFHFILFNSNSFKGSFVNYEKCRGIEQPVERGLI